VAAVRGSARPTVNFLLYQAGWWACVLGAAHGQVLWGPVVTVFALAAHFAWVSRRRAREALLVTVTGCVGAAVELVFMANDVYRLASPAPGIVAAGLWAAALWAMFAATFDGMLRWLHGRYGLAAALGAVGGPLAFLGGQALGAVVLNPAVTAGLLPLAVVWAVLPPLLLWSGKALGVWNR
jgi:hypothetical protein